VTTDFFDDECARATRQYAKTRKEWNYVERQAAHDAMVDQPQAVIDFIGSL
jgi:hypothetical protein